MSALWSCEREGSGATPIWEHIFDHRPGWERQTGVRHRDRTGGIGERDRVEPLDSLGPLYRESSQEDVARSSLVQDVDTDRYATGPEHPDQCLW